MIIMVGVCHIYRENANFCQVCRKNYLCVSILLYPNRLPKEDIDTFNLAVADIYGMCPGNGGGKNINRLLLAGIGQAYLFDRRFIRAKRITSARIMINHQNGSE